MNDFVVFWIWELRDVLSVCVRFEGIGHYHTI